MVVIGVIEDQWQDLLKACANFLVEASAGADIQVKPYLIAAESDIPQAEDIAYLQEEVQRYHPQITFPTIMNLPTILLGEAAQTKAVLERLAKDDIDVIVSDSQIGEDEVAGLRLLDSALTDDAFRLRGWAGYLMTKQFESASRWIYSKEKSLVDSKIRFLDKTQLLGSFPDQCTEAVSELIEREIAARRAAQTVSGKTRFGRFIGGSKSLNEGPDSPYAIAHIATMTDSIVLIRGESGVGKEVLANAIHEQSERKHKRFVAIDCGALSELTIESELFGHVRGAFTGADRDYEGKIVQADKGTLFLDEITNMPLTTQVKFLRLLGAQELTPLGSNKTRTVDFRLISATNADLDHLVKSNKFLFDLWSRIKTWQITLPPLRQRREDIPALVGDLVPRLKKKVGQKHFRVDEECMRMLQGSDWPENVRGLEQCIERAMGFALRTAGTEEQITITTEHLRLALPKPDLSEGNILDFSGDRPDPHPAMTPEQIWSGIRDHRLRRQSLPELRDLLGQEKIGEVITLAKHFIISEEGLTEFFPGTTPDNKRTIKSRSKRAGTGKKPTAN